MATTFNTPLINAMKARMSYLSERQKVIASNIAHSDTAGYKAKDIAAPERFNELVNSNQTKRVRMRLTSDMHKSGSVMIVPKFRVGDDPTATEEEPNGNTVVLEEQALKMSDIDIKHQEVSRAYKKFSDMMKLALESRG